MYHIYITLRKINLTDASNNIVGTARNMSLTLFQFTSVRNNRLLNNNIVTDAKGWTVYHTNIETSIAIMYAVHKTWSTGTLLSGYLGVTIPIVSSCWCLLRSSPALSSNCASWWDTTFILMMYTHVKHTRCGTLLFFSSLARCAYLHDEAPNAVYSCRNLPWW